jgi:ppGpp synthetase/RelA/SpoT-type nucleotidyltranferase
VTEQTTVADTDEGHAAEEQSIQDRAREARFAYEAERGLYQAFAKSAEDVLRGCLGASNIMVHEIASRAKDPDSFERKAAQPSPDYPEEPKYSDPLRQITDKAAVRIITYFLSTVDQVCAVVEQQFDIVDKEEKTNSDPDRLGYQSVHYLIRYSEARHSLPEYRRYTGLIAEVQVRTILQHAWAEIEHDIQYKAVATLPSQIRRRFASLAGLIEIADREFQAIEDADRALRAEARRNVDLGQLEQVEITGDSLRAYLDKKYGPDGRMSDFSYNWTASMLLKLGFANLAEVDECIKGRYDDQISRVIYGGRQGQLTRFEAVLLASMGEGFILAHPWTEQAGVSWFVPHVMHQLEKLRNAEIQIGDYRPPGYPETTLRSSDLAAIVEQAEAEEAARKAARQAEWAATIERAKAERDATQDSEPPSQSS